MESPRLISQLELEVLKFDHRGDMNDDALNSAITMANLKLQCLPSEAVMEANKGFPWSGLPAQLALEAPFSANRNNYLDNPTPFKLPMAVQTSKFFQLPQELLFGIAEHLSHQHGPMYKLAATSQEAFNGIGALYSQWDISRGWFGDCENSKSSLKPCFKPYCKDKEILFGRCSGCRDICKPYGNVAWSSTCVIVSRFREEVVSRNTFEHELDSIQTMHRALYNYSDSIKYLSFVEVDFLTIKQLEMFMPEQISLRNLQIMNCRMLHVGHLMALLKLVTTPSALAFGKKVGLNFYPKFQLGPKIGGRLVGRSFGVTYDTFRIGDRELARSGDIRLGVYAMLQVALPYARKHGIDLTSPDAAFRLWLEKIGLEDIDCTLNIVALFKADPAVVAKAVGTLGRNLYKPSSYTARGTAYYDQNYRCKGCQQTLSGIFFEDYEFSSHIRFPISAPTPCLGCMLRNFLNKEPDHWKREVRKSDHAWIGSLTMTPRKAFSAENIDRSLQVARSIEFEKERRVQRAIKFCCAELLWPQFMGREGFIYSDEISYRTPGFW